MSAFYGPDLAQIQHEGFGDFSRAAAPGLLAALRSAGITSGRVVDLGCGAGVWLAALSQAGYDAHGIEISPALARLARRAAPQAPVQIGSLYALPLPRCAALTALGEVLGYLPDAGRVPPFSVFFRRVARALRPGGLFLFDLIVRNARHPLHTRNFRVGADWAVLAESIEDPRRARLTREITTFRRVGVGYRRGHERHLVRLPSRDEILHALRDAGFRVHTGRRYGSFALAPQRVAFFARKPR